MDQETRQVFQSGSPRRWKNFVLAMRVILLLLVLSSATLIIAIFHESSAKIPNLIAKRAIKNLPKTSDLERYKKERNVSNNKLRPHSIKKKKSSHNNASSGIRAGFYVNWDYKYTIPTLQENLRNLNMILPEFLFLSEISDTVVTINEPKEAAKAKAAIAEMKKANVKILPMVSNFSPVTKEWSAKNVSRIVATKKSRTNFINSIIRYLEKNKFHGVNIDFEKLNPADNVNVLIFHYELYVTLHKKGFIVTKDVAPQNDNMDISRFSKNNDYLFIMAYDQNTVASDPGPIADTKWIEEILDACCEKVDPKKLVLSIAGYGYDWKDGAGGISLTNQMAIAYAKQYNANLDFDSDTYNVYYNYYDDDGISHDVYFADAATNFNNIRMAEDYGLAGVSLWRLGSEDLRLWSFFNDSLSFSGMKDDTSANFIDELKHGINDNIEWVGKGDIYDIEKIPQQGDIDITIDKSNMLITEEEYKTLPSPCIVRKFGYKKKNIVLTFDDGPDDEYTPRILDILKKNDVKAAFFVIGVNAENNISLLSRIYEEGHEIGNHTFAHPNVYEISPERFDFELNISRRLIECITGHSTILFRTPFNASYKAQSYFDIIPLYWAQQSNYYTVTESIDPYDWKKGTTADSIMARIIQSSNDGSIILLHDGGGDREATIEALPRIIRYFKLRGFTFTTIGNLLGKDRDFVMPALNTAGDKYMSNANWYVAIGFNWLEKFIYALFVVATILSVIRMLFIAAIAFIGKIQNKRIQKTFKNIGEFYPKVSVIVPAYNEEVHIVQNINNLLTSEYPDFEIIIIDDGSKDKTHQKAVDAFSQNPLIKIYTKPNGGKASALNFGIEKANGEIMVCIDADTQLQPDAVNKLIPYFFNKKVAAVAGNVKVGNERNLLTLWQSIEYITSQNFDRRAFEVLNCITVVPGAIGAFRKSVLEEAGMYTTDTLAEDCDITIRILKLGYKVSYSPNAIAYTEVPEALKMFMKQRFRWNFGILQSMWKHKYVFFNPRRKALGMIAFPNILLFQLMLPVFAPLADIMLIIGLITQNFSQILIYYLLFVTIEFLAGALAFSFEKENITRLLGIIPQRFIYRQLMYYVAIKSLLKAIKGELMSWGVQKRMGNIKTQKKEEERGIKV